MRIDWKSPAMTEAFVTRGWWRQRVAHVYADGSSGLVAWKFAATGRECDWDLGIELTRARDAARLKAQTSAEWIAVRSMPTARRVLK